MPVYASKTIKFLVITCVVAYLIQIFGDTFFSSRILETFGLVPSLFYDHHHYWQLLTYMFMHADMFHILFNMLILWMIGSELEAQWGKAEFLRYYFICGVSGGVFYLIVNAFLSGTPAQLIPVVGASGAIYGLLVAYGLIYSERTMLFMMVFPMKAKHFVLILASVEFISTVFYSRSGIANAAHLGGMFIGFLYLIAKAYLRIKAKRNPGSGKGNKKKRVPKSQHLRLVVNNELLTEFDDDDGDDDSDDSRDGKPTIH